MTHRHRIRTMPRIRPRARVLLAGAVTVVVLVALCGLALSLGDEPTTPAALWEALHRRGPENTVYAVVEVRLPRVAMAVIVGAAFGIAGGLSQSVLRNPLASPDVLGVAAGASVGAVLVISAGALGGPIGLVPIPVAALAGGFGAAGLIAMFAVDRSFRGRRILLVGIAISMALTGVTQYLLTRIDVYDAQRSAAWLTGSLNARDWQDAVPVAVGLCVLVPVILVLGHSSRALIFGDDLVSAWGVAAGRVRVVLLVCAVCLAALATAAAGPVAFVALVAGQASRRAARVPDIPPLLAGMTGALIVLAADTVARTVLPVQLPVGVLTALVGAPYLLYVLQRRRGRKGQTL